MFCCEQYKGWGLYRLVCYDFSLHEQWHYDFSDTSTFMEPVIDSDLGILYFQRTPRITTAFDLEQSKIIMEDAIQYNGYRTLGAFLPGIGLVCRRNSSSSIDVLDRNLQLISQHRTKGDIYHFIPQNGRLFILTYRPEKAQWFYNGDNTYFCEVDKPGHTYVYELKNNGAPTLF